jgi:hypothetical protein
MFTWICPKCGAEVPPSENECPNCRGKSTPAPAAPAAAPVANPHVEPAPPPAPPPAVAAARRPVDPILIAVGSAVGILALLAILYLYVLPRSSAKSTTTTALEDPGTAGSSAAAPVNPLTKYIEISGVRVMEDGNGQAKIGYVVVNHSPADLPDLKAQITLSAGGKVIFEIPASIPSIGPYESKDLSAKIRTQLKPYELPDWQALKPSLKIISER